MTDTLAGTEIKYVCSTDYWKKVRAGGRADASDGEVHLGSYRLIDKYNKKRGGDAISIWEAAPGVVAAAINGKQIADHYDVYGNDNRTSLASIFQRCMRRPITDDEYWAHVDTGTWPDLNEVVSLQLEEETRERIGGNNPPPDDSYEGLEDQIKTLSLEVAELIKKGAAKTKEDADKAGDLADALGKLWNKADKAREIEKAPHWQKCCEIQEKWKPLLSAAEIYKRVKQVIITPWQIKAEQQRQAELRRQREEADRLQREAEEAQRKADEEAQRIADEQARAAQAGLSSPDDDKQAQDALEEAAQEADKIKEQAAEAARLADQTAKSTVKVGGTRGRAIALKTFHIAKCVDRRAASSALRDNGDFLTEIDALIESYARKLKSEDGIELPGVEYTVEQRAA